MLRGNSSCCTQDSPGGAGGPYGMLGVESGMATYMERVPSTVLSLSPQMEWIFKRWSLKKTFVGAILI